jgi:hypothetical protein
MMPAMLRTIVFVAMIASVSASETLNALVKASADFAAAIVQQLAAIQSLERWLRPGTYRCT